MGTKFILLISSVLTSSFKIRDLQVRFLAKSILFSGLHFAFAHLKVLYEAVRLFLSLVAPFGGRIVTGSYL